MEINDRRRRFLYDGLTAGLGADVADALMDHLPPAGWSDLVTKSDLEKSAALLTAAFHRDMVRQTWIFAGTVVAAMGALGGLLR